MVRKKIRRGGVRRRRDRRLKKDIYTRKELEIYHLNIRGLDSKIVSLKGILKTISPDIVTLNETHYVNKRRINIEGYEPFQRNRIGKGGGGIATLVKKCHSSDTIKIKEGVDQDEYIVTKHDNFAIPINIINVYGEAESRASKQEIEDRWYRIISELKSIESKGEFALLIGDMNKHVGNTVKDNHLKTSFGGKLVNDLIRSNKYVLVNACDKVVGGPFTRFDPSCPKDVNSMSCIDLIIASKGLVDHIDTMIIDRNQCFTPSRPLQNGHCFPDHYGILLKLKNLPPATRRKPDQVKMKMWNLHKENGWQKYTEVTDNNDQLRDIADKNVHDPTRTMELIDKQMEKAKYKAFGKVTYVPGKSVNKELVALHNEKMKVKNSVQFDEVQVDTIDKKINEVVLKEQKVEFEKKIEKLKNKKSVKGKCAAIFALKNDVTGGKQVTQVATTLIDPASNVEISERSLIKMASLNYCVDLLTNRVARKGYEDDVSMKNLVHQNRMKDKEEVEVQLSREMFDASLDELAKKNKEKYAFILNGGIDLKDALFKLFSTVWDTEERPDQWRQTTLIQLYKGKGDPRLLSNMRNIHIKRDIPKFFGHIVMTQAKQIIMNNMTKFQIGTKVGYRVQEHLFVMKSIIALYLKHGLPVFVQLYDISKFFDRENLRDGMDALFNYGIQGKIYRLIYNMNKDTIIRVRTAVGTTEKHETGENIGQGTLEGAVVSAASLDYTVNKFFSESKHELSYGSVNLQPLLFQDDIGRISTSLEDVQVGNSKLESLMETKLLDFNLDKSCLIVMGNRGKRKQANEQLKSFPVTLCNKAMKVADHEKYLGDILSSEGLSQSVFLTVLRRKPQVINSIFEVNTVIEDCRTNLVGGLTAGLEIWELSIIPFLLNNSETWVEIDKKTLDMLDNMQFMFLRYLFKTPRTCPKPALLWESGAMQMSHRIAIRKLMFLHHLTNLPSNSLAYEVKQVQEKLAYPGLIKECNDLIECYGLPEPHGLSKNTWKCQVKRSVRIKSRIDLLDSIKRYSKIDAKQLLKEEYKMKSYILALNVPDARLKFALRAKMLRSVKMNFKGVKEYANCNWECDTCNVPDTQEHLFECKAYSNLRNGKDLRNDKEIVDYVRQIVVLRSSDCSGT